MNSERDAEILRLYHEGKMVKEIARAVGMAPNSMVGILRRLGIERPSKPQRLWHDRPDLTEEIGALWKAGLCATQIRERLSTTQGIVDAALLKLGLRSKNAPRHRYDGGAVGGSGRSGFAGSMARRT